MANNKSDNKWTEEEIQYLVDGYKNKDKRMSIAITLGRSIGSIAIKARKLGITNKRSLKS